MGFSVSVSLSAFAVFVQGILSFFSPCVLPVIPVYIGYLSGGTGRTDEEGRVIYNRGRVIFHTLFFVLGVSFTFFLLGMGVTAVSSFFNSSRSWIAGIGGVLVLLFGMYQLGLFHNFTFLMKDRRLPFSPNVRAMSPLVALAMGFTFSFAWTPCVGPILASVLLMAASADTHVLAMGLIALYCLGFVLPFLAVGLFTSSLLDFFREHRQVVKITEKICGVILIVMGILMLTGQMNRISGFLSSVNNTMTIRASAAEDFEREQETEPEDETEITIYPEIDFTLTDQYGSEHTLSDYKGKTVFLNFWATWCPPCLEEMPYIQELYEEYDTEGEDALIVLGVASPETGAETDEEGIIQFLEENGYTYPVLMDTGGSVQLAYQIYYYPTTYMIDRDGNIYGYATGSLTKEIMDDIVAQTMGEQAEE